MKIAIKLQSGEQLGVEAARIYVPGFEWLDACAHQAVMDAEVLEDRWAISCPHSGFRFLAEGHERRPGAATLDEEIDYVARLLRAANVTPEMLESARGKAAKKWQSIIDKDEDK